ncbi:MAG: dihydrodipicolinate synthase family protein [Devosia nanyangense]|uniref:Dihydrodipicolinate synthase family protein n=1 Tax=Devosia nanyangense TaxID=1228055 RepID=A0A933L817_9HYPH|nr:dihydrodipicolinate synthase family protein [Devosia nanyangense]
MEIGGTYPMLYAFFDAAGRLRRDAVSRQVSAALASGASGIAVLGLGTEVAKLGRDERRQLVEWTLADVAGRRPVAVTVADGNIPDMIESARFARAAGAAWLILQPPRPPASGADLIAFFGAVADSVDCPIGIQNAPEFLGIGLSPADLLALNAAHPNVTVVKAESTALTVAGVIEQVGGRMKVFNGRAGFELLDNLRAGVDGMIPGTETIDLQVGIERAMRSGNETLAADLYRKVLPVIAFAMQGLGTFLLYGKLIAAERLGIAPSENRIPSDTATPTGLAWAKRFAAELGPLPA